MPPNSQIPPSCGGKAAGVPRPAFSPALKIALAFIYACFAVSFPKYDLAGVCIFASLPLFAVCAFSKDIGRSLKNSLAAIPVALAIGAANPWLDASPPFDFGFAKIPAGAVSLAVLCAKAWECAMAAVAFSQAASPNEMAKGLAALGVPCPVALQMSLTMRYIPIISGEAKRMGAAYSARSGRIGGAAKISDWPKLAGSLMLRSLDRATSVYDAMRARGFEAKFPRGRFSGRAPASDFIAAAAFACVCALFRFLPERIFS